MNHPLDAALGAQPYSAAELREARARAGAEGLRRIDALRELDGGDSLLALMRLAATLHLDWIDSAGIDALTPDLAAIGFDAALRHECVALRDAAGKLTVALADPLDGAVLDWIAVALGEPYRVAVARSEDLAALLARHEGARADAGLDGSLQDDGAEVVADLSLKRIAEDSSPVVRTVNSTLYDALKQGASDIHLESVPGGMQVKLRIDGVLTRVGSIAGAEVAEQVISRIKVMAELDIAERRVPQDGRFKAQAQGRDIDFRVSIMPSIHGEDAVLRVLDKEHLADNMRGLTLEALGLDETMRALLRRQASEPYGMLLVTGPTGSGKTTTLYATLSETNTGLDKVVTIEDPVEYQLPGVLQIPVNEKKGLTFSRGLRSILRHDPDKIMVGEIRDPDTAEIAVQAALTGHLVFTTVHANSVFDVIGRFVHMGIDPYNLVAALNAVVAQRLIRVLCPACAHDDAPDAELLRASGVDELAAAEWRFKNARGCGECRGSGYRGRRAIAELLILDDELRELIVSRAPLRTLKEAARRRGFRSLREAGLALVAAGQTTLQELNRVTFVG